jgi:hypothetical protein
MGKYQNRRCHEDKHRFERRLRAGRPKCHYVDNRAGLLPQQQTVELALTDHDGSARFGRAGIQSTEGAALNDPVFWMRAIRATHIDHPQGLAIELGNHDALIHENAGVLPLAALYRSRADLMVFRANPRRMSKPRASLLAADHSAASHALTILRAAFCQSRCGVAFKTAKWGATILLGDLGGVGDLDSAERGTAIPPNSLSAC